jgi:D-ribose pyranose/furanose isomerase RbsD
MKRTSGIIHPQLSRVIAECGHTDAIVVADAGLPIPLGVERVDLAYRAGSPAFLDILDCVLAEFVVERAVISEEMEAQSPGIAWRWSGYWSTLCLTPTSKPSPVMPERSCALESTRRIRM